MLVFFFEYVFMEVDIIVGGGGVQSYLYLIDDILYWILGKIICDGNV